jgi:hypothetical protein
MFDREKRNLVRVALKAAGYPEVKIAEVLAVVDDRGPTKGELRPLALNQSRAAELLSCSRFHIRKLERLGLLKPVDLAGLKRYPLSEVVKLVGGEVANV